MSHPIKLRKNARRLVLQALYQWQINPVPVQDLLAEFLVKAKAKKIDQEYFQQLVKGVVNNAQELDELFRPYLDRDISALDPVELALLRYATYELKERLDIPYKVVINEACEVAKEFGTVEGYKYVNGVLDKLAEQVRPHEKQF